MSHNHAEIDVLLLPLQLVTPAHTHTYITKGITYLKRTLE